MSQLSIWEMAFFLLAGHALADYSLQSDFIAQAKSRFTELGRVYWKAVLPAHSIIHGAFVAWITGSVLLGILETICHALIDDAKCAQRLSFYQDQLLHVLCKVLWLVIFVVFLT